MTRSEIERAVARATGETRGTIRRYGFTLIPDEPEADSGPTLVVDCPGCGARASTRPNTSTTFGSSSNGAVAIRSIPSQKKKSMWTTRRT